MLRMSAVASLALLALGGPVAMAQQAPMTSRITSYEVARVTSENGFNRIAGVVRGVIDPRESVVGLAGLPKNAAGEYEYASDFEIIQAPARVGPLDAGNLDVIVSRGPEVIYIDSENRGSAISQSALGDFLRERRASYARVRWQTGISAGVPAQAQGVGLVIMRDFARMLKQEPSRTNRPGSLAPVGAREAASPCREPVGIVVSLGPPECRPLTSDKLILGGVSQSAWFVNTFIAEGFNVDPVTGKGVFDAAIAVDGAGGWLAINTIAAQRGLKTQTPYIDPDGVPLSRTELLSRPSTDPLYVDIANYTDFYRLRAGLTSTDHSSDRFRRYDFPSPHAVGTAAGAARCERPAAFNTIRYAPYMRALTLGVMKAIGVKSAENARPLPPSMVFRLGSQPAPSSGFNGLPGREVKVPQVDKDAWPVGGVRFAEADLPLGRPVPPAVGPAVTTSISATCGNFGGFAPFTTAEKVERYGSREAYLERYAAALDRLVAQGWLLAQDRSEMLRTAATAYDA